MSQQEIIFAGFGGQGIMSMGMLLAYAGMQAGKEVSWIPSYGPEMRGGTANCAVVVGDDPIASPLVNEPTAAVVMNSPSVARFAPQITPGGVLLVNASMAPTDTVDRNDITVASVPATGTANELGNIRIANMVALGAFLELVPVVSLEAVEEALTAVLPPRRHSLIPLNREALKRGRDWVRSKSAEA